MTENIENFAHDLEIKKSVLSQYGNFFKKFTLHALYLSLLFGLVFYWKHETNSIKQFSQISIAHEADILTALNDLSMKMDTWSADHSQIAELKTQISHMEQTMVTAQSLSDLAKTSELQKVIAQLNQLTHPLTATPFHQKSSHFPSKKPLLRAKLPFQILSVDSIVGQAYVSVQYHQDTLPLRLNEQLAGWTIVQIEPATGVIVWENPQRRRIKIIASRSAHE